MNTDEKAQGLKAKYYANIVRLRLKEADARLRRWKDAIFFGATVFAALLVGSTCAFILVSGTFSADDKQRATSILTPMISALLGYLTGKTTK
jgi:cytochrome bd-type quinol oxidase subunit 2